MSSISDSCSLLIFKPIQVNLIFDTMKDGLLMKFDFAEKQLIVANVGVFRVCFGVDLGKSE